MIDIMFYPYHPVFINIDCILCKFSPKFADNIVSSVTKEIIPILSNLTCNSENIINCITCTKDNGNYKSKTFVAFDALSGKMLVVRIIENYKIDAYFRSG